MRVDGVVVRMNDTRIYHQVSLCAYLVAMVTHTPTGWH